MLKIKEWKYNDMMHKVCQFGGKWMDIDSWKRDAENFNQVVVEDGFVSYEGRFEILKETAKAVQVNFNGSWKEWLPKSTVVIA